MDIDLVRAASKFNKSFERMADTTEKIGNLIVKVGAKIDEEMAKHANRHSKYFAKSGDQFKLATDITIPAKPESLIDFPKGDVDPDKRVEEPKDKVIEAGTIVMVKVTVRHQDLVYKLVHNDDPFVTVSGYELKEMLEGGLLEEV